MDLSEQQKLTVFSLIQNDKTPKMISEELEIPYPKILKMRQEYRDAIANGTLSKLIDVDKLTVHRIAETVKDDLKDVAPLEGELLEDVDKTVSNIDTYQVLSDKMQTTGLKLTDKINDLSDLVSTPESLLTLVEALAKLQNAFFNKNVNNINILNQPGNGSPNQITKFAAFKKS